jgi:hypothetical protein
MDEVRNGDDRIDAIGRRLSTVIIALLAALFAYGYLGHLFG